MPGKKPPEGEKAPGAGRSGGGKDKKPGKLPKFKFAQREVFDQSEYLEKEVKNISYERLRRDETQQYGQIRPLLESHLQKLVAEFKANPPREINLIVWLHAGVLSPLPHSPSSPNPIGFTTLGP